MKLAPASLFLVLLGLAATGLDLQPALSPEDSEAKAKQLWELAIAAKGGRERLHRVESVFRSYARTYTLAVFPDRFLEWEDSRPSPLGLSVQMHRLDKDIGYYVSERMKKPSLRSDTEYASGRLRRLQLMYLMETLWVKPAPYDAGEEIFNRKAFDVVYATAHGWEVSYLLDKETHLPMAYRFHGKKGVAERASDPPLIMEFRDYVEVDGIKMPGKERGPQMPIELTKMPWIETKFEFNVEYDPRVFERPPSIEDGPNAWRRLPRP